MRMKLVSSFRLRASLQYASASLTIILSSRDMAPTSLKGILWCLRTLSRSQVAPLHVSLARGTW